MKNYETKSVDQQILKNIKCDYCGKKYDYVNDMFECQEIIQIKHECGYDSVFGDGEFLDIDICQHCFKKIIKNMEY
jgi:hypothetical protein